MRAKRTHQRKAPWREFLDTVPFERHRATALPCCAGVSLRQANVDLLRLARAKRPVEPARSAALVAEIGVADRLREDPVPVLAQVRTQDCRRAHAEQIAGRKIGVKRRIGQRAVVIAGIDVLHDRTGDMPLTHVVEHLRTQGRKFDRFHAFRGIEAAGKRAAQEDVAPARHQRPARSFQRGTHQCARLPGQRASRKPAFRTGDHANAGDCPARDRRHVELGTKAE